MRLRLATVTSQMRRGVNAARRSGIWPSQPGWSGNAVRQGRMALYQGATRLLGGPVLGRLPFSWVPAAAQIVPNPVLAGRIEDIRPGAPLCTLTFPERHAGFECFTRSVTLGPTSDFVAVDALVSPRTGLVWFDGGPVLGESYGSVEQFLSWGYAAHEVLASRVTEAATAEAPLACVPTASYFHLVLETLPSLLRSIERGDPSAWLLWSAAPRYVEETASLLHALGGGTVVRAPGPVRATRVRVAGRRALSGHFDSFDLDRLRRFGAHLASGRSSSGVPDRIYVTRSGASRALVNEAGVSQFLVDRGFRVVDPGRHSIAEQVVIFGAAHTVVGPHGAGLANLVWSRPGTNVVELLLPERNLDCYARLSHLAGLVYRPLATLGGCVDLAELADALDG